MVLISDLAEFRDGLSLRYGFQPKIFPQNSPVANTSQSHTHSTVEQEVIITWVTEIRDTFAKLMRDLCYDVEIEPKLQTLEGESVDYRTTSTEDEARLHIKHSRLWDSRFCRSF